MCQQCVTSTRWVVQSESNKESKIDMGSLPEVPTGVNGRIPTWMFKCRR